MTMIYGKINGSWNIGHWPTYILQGWFLSHDHYSKYNISPSNSLQDTKQNHWTINIGHWPTYTWQGQSICQLIILKILSKINRPWNIGHVDLYSLWGQSLGHTGSLSENMTFMHQLVLEIYEKINGPWNIGHIDLHLFWGQTSGHTDP